MDNQLVLVLTLKNIKSSKEKWDSGSEGFSFVLDIKSRSMIKVLFILVSERGFFLHVVSAGYWICSFASWISPTGRAATGRADSGRQCSTPLRGGFWWVRDFRAKGPLIDLIVHWWWVVSKYRQVQKHIVIWYMWLYSLIIKGLWMSRYFWRGWPIFMVGIRMKKPSETGVILVWLQIIGLSTGTS